MEYSLVEKEEENRWAQTACYRTDTGPFSCSQPGVRPRIYTLPPPPARALSLCHLEAPHSALGLLEMAAAKTSGGKTKLTEPKMNQTRAMKAGLQVSTFTCKLLVKDVPPPPYASRLRLVSRRTYPLFFEASHSTQHRR